MEAIGLGGEANAGRRLTVLRAIDKLDRLGVEGIRMLLGKGRKDESGDFTKGAQLDEEQINVMIGCLTAEGRDGKEKLKNFARQKPRDFTSDSNKPSYEKLISMLLICERAGYYQDRIAFDPSVVRGLEYYTGPVFEADLTFEIDGEDGKPIRFGSIGGGGRYDGLVGRFRGEDVPATGFSIGVSRLYAALKAIGSPIVSAGVKRGPVVVLVLDQGEIARYQSFVTELRNAGIRRRTLSRAIRHERAAEICR